jgi:hypothetical protein
MFTPLSLNCTPTTPTLSVAVAATATVEPETDELFAGAEMETVGNVVSGIVKVNDLGDPVSNDDIAESEVSMP